MEIFSFVPENILSQNKYSFSENLQGIEKTFLTIIFSSREFLFAISSNSFSQIHEVHEISFEENPTVTDRISEVITNYSLAKRKFEKVNILILNNKFSIIPEVFEEEGNLKKNLHFSTGEKDIKQTLKHKLNSISFSYFYDDNTISFLEKTFPHSTIYHHGAIAVSIFIEHALFSHCDVWLNIHKSEIEILVKENNALMFYNMFLYKTTEDILYFLLFSFEQLNLKPDYTRLVISCNTHVDEEPIKSISKYIKNVRLLHRDTTNIVLPESQSSMPGHFYFTLFHQHLCVL